MRKRKYRAQTKESQNCKTIFSNCEKLPVPLDNFEDVLPIPTTVPLIDTMTILLKKTTTAHYDTVYRKLH